MKKIILILLSGLLLSFVVSSFADNPNLKVGVLKIETLLKGSPKYAKTTQQLQASLADGRGQVLAARNNLQSKQSKLQKEGSKMNVADRTALQADITTAQKNLILLSQKLSKEAMDRQSKEMQAFSDSLNAAVSTVAKKDGLNLVLVDQSAIYFDQSLDITAQVAKVFG